MEIAAPVLTKEEQKTAIPVITGEEDMPMRELVDRINDKKYYFCSHSFFNITHFGFDIQ